MFISNVCRISEEVVQKIAHSTILAPGKNEISTEILEPRQIRFNRPTETGTCDYVVSCAATVKLHRGSFITVIPRSVAGELVRDKVATWEPQYLLCYAMEDYVADKDVQADPVELARAEKALEDGEDLAVVAVIGENRSCLSVCRNIVSGCQQPDTLVSDAAGAMAAHDIFLVEE